MLIGTFVFTLLAVIFYRLSLKQPSFVVAHNQQTAAIAFLGIAVVCFAIFITPAGM